MPLLCTEGMRSICRGCCLGRVLPAAALGSVPESPPCLCSELGLGCAVTCRGYRTTTARQQMSSGSCWVFFMKFRCKHIPSMLLLCFLLQWFPPLVDQRPLHLPFISRNRNIISVPESCVSRKEIAYRYREVVTVTHFNLPSTTFGKKKPQEKKELLHQCFLGACSKTKGTHKNVHI